MPIEKDMRGLLVALLLLPACGDDEPERPKQQGRAPEVVEDAQIVRARLEMKELKAELESHHALRGEWPEDWRALKRSGKDPWGNEYQFEIDVEEAIVYCAGPDGEFGTDDDIEDH